MYYPDFPILVIKIKNRIFVIMKKLLILLFIIPLLGISQTSTTSSGNWYDNSNWSNNTPVQNTEAYVNHYITLDNSISIGNGGEYYINDSLIYSTNQNVSMNGSGYLEINAYTEINDIQLSNRSEIYINCDTLIVNGNMSLSNNTYMEIADCGVLIIRGDLNMSNNNTNLVNGIIYVEGDAYSNNNASMDGNGILQTVGQTYINNNSDLFGSDIPCNSNCEYGGGAGLSIELNDFSVYSNNKIVVQWSTLSEINNDYFIVETDNFSDTIKGNGNSNSYKEYSLTIDKCGEYYINLYSVDFDGIKELEGTEYIENKCSDNIIYDGDKFIINDGNIKSIKIFDIQGKLINEKFINNENNSYIYSNKKGYNIVYVESDTYYNKKFYLK